MENITLNYLICNEKRRIIESYPKEIDGALIKYLNHKCIEKGSTLIGRIESFNNVTGAKQKPCIYIDDRTFLIPSKSFKRSDAILINYWMINKIKRSGNRRTIVKFKDNSAIEIECDSRVLNRQIDRCAEYISKML